MIEREVKEIISLLGHFPSKGDLTDMQKGALSSAIQKRGGFVEWSKRLNIPRAVAKSEWDEERIESETKAFAAKVGHFPSTSELKNAGRHDLSNILCKRGGMAYWSNRLGLPRQHSDSDTGWEGEEAVKQILEGKGFKVSTRTGVKCPYDLIVNDRVRCDVKTTKQATYNLNTGMPWSAWFYRIGKSVQSDMVILYQSDIKDCYILPWWEVGTTNITISPSSPKYGKFRNRFDLLESYANAVKTITV